MTVSIEEIKKHNTKKDCWVIIHGKVYNVSDFIDEHPGGSAIILKYAGKDATKAFDPVHPGDTLIKYLAPKYHLGDAEKSTAPKKKNDEYDDDEDEPPTPEELDRRQLVKNKPDLSQMYNLNDFEFVARHTMEKTAWAYYSSGCDDEITLRENHVSYQRIFFKPRVLVDVSEIDLSTTMLGTKVSIPIYITATALGKLGHPDGEKVLTRSAAKQDVIQMIPTLASCSFDEIVDQAIDKQTQWLQLYVNKDRKICESIVRHAQKRGIKGLFITVDAPQLGRREKDMRSKKVEDLSHVQGDDDEADRTQGAARAISSFIDTSLNWKDIKWFRSITKMPIILKGIQTVEDSLLAIEHGVDGIVLSNHGGRQLEFSKPPLEVLIELMPILKSKGLQDKLEIYIDGGVRRATDVLKAICLGAKGVGLGRPFLYAMSTYGDEGVYKAIQILKDEMIMNMRLLGVTSIDQLNDSYIDTRNFQTRYLPEDRLFGSVYEPLVSPTFKSSKL
ncbi:cytochrome b2, mitochondrial precursor [Scheffersomyces coipomensis]|uniref:cytochrome b2, mitochondrial precursor n=1 Tax=Scheffersomyces coipomensis TaxID=1788519 RepID=UPI00315D1673